MLKIKYVDLLVTALAFFWIGAIYQDSITPSCREFMEVSCSSSPTPYVIVGMGMGFLLSYALLRSVGDTLK